MPELPEVETIRRQLSKKIVGKKINKQKIVGLRRRAKILIIDFSRGSSSRASKGSEGERRDRVSSHLIFHLKLTGQLIFNGKISRHTRKVFYFNDGSRLIFNDLRRFGWYKIVKNTNKIEDEFGPEALEINLKTFKADLSKRPNSKIKPLLMDQKFIAGLGNIYSDEILFASKVQPLRLVKTLKEGEIKEIHQNIKTILKAAIKLHGSSVKDYIDACGRQGNYAKQHKVYQKEGEPCFRCRTKIQRKKLAGRSAYYCPICQK